MEVFRQKRIISHKKRSWELSFILSLSNHLRKNIEIHTYKQSHTHTKERSILRCLVHTIIDKVRQEEKERKTITYTKHYTNRK